MTTFVRSHSLDPTVKHGDTSYSTASYPPARLATPRDDLHHFVTAAEGSRRLRLRVERLTVQEPTASSIGKSWPGPEAGLIEHACRHVRVLVLANSTDKSEQCHMHAAAAVARRLHVTPSA
jgi:hypothetical protein